MRTMMVMIRMMMMAMMMTKENRLFVWRPLLLICEFGQC